MNVDDLIRTVTEDLIAAIEVGAPETRMPWHTIAVTGPPVSVDHRPYRSLNSLVLALRGYEQGYTSSVWSTYLGWQRHDAQVRRGERGTRVLLWRPPAPHRDDADDTDDTDDGGGRDVRRRGWYGRTFMVFAAEQVDNPPAHTVGRTHERDTATRIVDADAYFAAVGADVVEGGNRAFYDRTADRIHLPALTQFDTPALFYGAAGHEHVHWSGAPQRLGRVFGERFGDDAYAVEELVAELGAAFWCAQAGLSASTRDDHAGYLAGWVKVLREQPRVLLTVASKAQAALDYLNRCAGYGPPAVDADDHQPSRRDLAA